jgi:two-component sensor histidine kinase
MSFDGEEANSSLALAVVLSSSSPLLLLDAGLTVLAASKSFIRAFGLDAGRVTGVTLEKLGGGEWGSRPLAALLRATASGNASIDEYEMDLQRPDQATRCLVLNAQKLVYGDGHDTRLLLAISDVTDARLAARVKDDLVREKGLLLLELQHRVANSLQIIASLLLQSARRVQSDETRSHLQAAHQRVMSVASVQRQLAMSRHDQVALRPYFTELCASLGASMIRDPAQIKLAASCDDSVISAEVSVSLGLIVTELVINALKHAFPDDRGGSITVDYRADGASWALTVRDTGTGMVGRAETATAGLGTSIVNALATQLKATIDITDNRPGTIVSVTHDALANSDLTLAVEAV